MPVANKTPSNKKAPKRKRMPVVIAVSLTVVGIVFALGTLDIVVRHIRTNVLIVIGRETVATVKAVKYVSRLEPRVAAPKDTFSYALTVGGAPPRQYVVENTTTALLGAAGSREYYTSGLLLPGDSMVFDDGRTVPVLVNDSTSMLIIGDRADAIASVIVWDLIIVAGIAYFIWYRRRPAVQKV